MQQNTVSRRLFLKFLAGSPLLASLGWLTSCNGGPQSAGGDSEIYTTAFRELEGRIDELISSPEKAINIFDFEKVTRAKLPPAHYGYLTTGVENDRTKRANREAFSDIYLRPRRLVNVADIDMRTDLFGVSWETPIVLAPVASQKAFHSAGEVAVAKAAKNQKHLKILSTLSSTSIEEVTTVYGRAVWYQLYPTSRWEVARAMLSRAESAGSPVVVLTVDIPTSSNRETLERLKRQDTRDCSTCHSATLEGDLKSKPMFEDLNIAGVYSPLAPAITWDFVNRLKGETNMKVVLKGIVTREDAQLSIKHGADGIIVSNHGGRAEESCRATIESLPEVADAVGGKIPILVDSGFRRGSDIFKALALGASAVCIGRPYLWGLTAFGQAGVEMVLKILRAELRDVMMFSGTPSIREITRSHVGVA